MLMRVHSLVVVFFWKVVFRLSLFTVLIGYVLALLITLKNHTKVFPPLLQSSAAAELRCPTTFQFLVLFTGFVHLRKTGEPFFFFSSQVLVRCYT